MSRIAVRIVFVHTTRGGTELLLSVEDSVKLRLAITAGESGLSVTLYPYYIEASGNKVEIGDEVLCTSVTFNLSHVISVGDSFRGGFYDL